MATTTPTMVASPYTTRWDSPGIDRSGGHLHRTNSGAEPNAERLCHDRFAPQRTPYRMPFPAHWFPKFLNQRHRLCRSTHQ